MANEEDPNPNPENPHRKQPENTENGQKDGSMFSPRFRSVAAMAGWDEETLLVASLIVEDTPDRLSKQKKRSVLQSLKTPPSSNSRRKRRAQRRSPASIPPVAVFSLDEDEPLSKQEKEKTKIEVTVEVEKKAGDGDAKKVSEASPAIPCMDRLREELSCAICLEICYEPSTTPCGHSFCKNCLRSAADKCGRKCPKCRQLISKGRYCTVNTVLWNTIQLLFPQEVETRKASTAAASTDTHGEPHQTEESSAIPRRQSARHRPVQALSSQENERTDRERRIHRLRSHNLLRASSGLSADFNVRSPLPSQDQDAALALRLQREEFMEVFREPEQHSSSRRSSLAMARANLRAMASRAINYRTRDRAS